MSAWVWIVAAILILANSLYVAAEFGAVGVRRSRVRRLSEEGHRLAQRLLPYVESPQRLDRYIGTSQIGITVSSLMLGAYAQATFGTALAPHLVSWFDLADRAAETVSALVVLALLTSVQLVIGELVPKALALQYPTETALATVWPIQASLVVFRPLLALLNGAAVMLLRLAGVREQSHRHLHSPEEIDLLIAESHDGGLLEPEERQRLRRALNLGLRTARDLMVPLERLTLVDLASSWADVVRTVAASPFSRLPVFSGRREDIVGLLRTKDLVDRYVTEGPLPLGRLMRPLSRVGDDTPADRLLSELRSRRIHSALVVDRTGKVVGLVTIQDVLGELLGLRSAAAPS